MMEKTKTKKEIKLEIKVLENKRNNFNDMLQASHNMVAHFYKKSCELDEKIRQLEKTI